MPENIQRDDHKGTARPEQPPPEPAASALEIKFENQNGNSIAFKLKPTTSLKKAMDAYCDRSDARRGSLRFLFDGERVQEGDTPASLSFHGEASLLEGVSLTFA